MILEKVIRTNYLSPPNCNGSFIPSKKVRTPITWVSRAARFVIALLINLRRSANSLCYLSWYTCMILLEINPQPIWDVILVILVYILVCILVCVSPNEFVWPRHFHLNYYPSCRTQDSFAVPPFKAKLEHTLSNRFQISIVILPPSEGKDWHVLNASSWSTGGILSEMDTFEVATLKFLISGIHR